MERTPQSSNGIKKRRVGERDGGPGQIEEEGRTGGGGDGGVELGAKHQPPTTEGEEGRKGGWINSKKGKKKRKEPHESSGE